MKAPGKESTINPEKYRKNGETLIGSAKIITQSYNTIRLHTTETQDANRSPKPLTIHQHITVLQTMAA